MGILRSLFCSHSYKKIKEYHGSSRIMEDGTYLDLPYGYKWKSNVVSCGKVNQYKCIKCGNEYHKFIGGCVTVDENGK